MKTCLNLSWSCCCLKTVWLGLIFVWMTSTLAWDCESYQRVYKTCLSLSCLKSSEIQQFWRLTPVWIWFLDQIFHSPQHQSPASSPDFQEHSHWSWLEILLSNHSCSHPTAQVAQMSFWCALFVFSLKNIWHTLKLTECPDILLYKLTQIRKLSFIQFLRKVF